MANTPSLNSAKPICQDGRIPVSPSGASPELRINLAIDRPPSFSPAILPVGMLAFTSAGTIEVSVSAIIVVGTAIFVLFASILARSRDNAQSAEENRKLVATLRRSEGQARESEASLKHQVEQLKHEIAGLVEVTPGRLSEVGATARLTIPPDGSEVFLPPLDARRVYQLTFHGTCKFTEPAGWFSRREAKADALHRTDDVGNFLYNHDCLKLADVPIKHYMKDVPPETMPEEDRNAHRYGFRIDGVPKKLSARFCLKLGGDWAGQSGALTLTIETLPDGTLSPDAGRRREAVAREEAAEAARVARDAAAHAAADAKRTAGLHTKLESLRLRVQCDSHLLDPEFQEQYARHHMKKILEADGPTWAHDYETFMRDCELRELAKQAAPEVISWLEARVKIVQLAERFAVAPPPAPKVEMLTPEENRDARLRKHAQRHDDKIALTKLKGEKAIEADAAVEALPLDSDLKERLRTELTDSILDDDSEGEKENGHVTL